MRVVQLLTQSRGGPVDHAVDVAGELVRLGHESHLLGPAGPHLDRARDQGVQVAQVDVRSKHDLTGARAVDGALTRLRPDVVHLQDRRAGLVGRAVALRRGLPSVYTLHGVPDPLAGLVPGNHDFLGLPRSATRRARLDNLTLERLLARVRGSAVITPCEALAGYARTHVGIPAARVRAVHNGVPATWLEPGRETSDMRRPGRVTALWLGVMQPVKRVPELVAAAAGVEGLDLVLVGDGPERGRVEAAVAAAGAGDRIRLLGYRDDPAPLVRTADLLVLPSAAEACPMVVLQAMACGIPVVASRAGGIPELIRDGVDGRLVATADDTALRAALAELAADPALRERLGAAARDRVAESFTVRRCTEGLVAAYTEVAR